MVRTSLAPRHLGSGRRWSRNPEQEPRACSLRGSSPGSLGASPLAKRSFLLRQGQEPASGCGANDRLSPLSQGEQQGCPSTRPGLLAFSRAGAAQEVVEPTFTHRQSQRGVHLVRGRDHFLFLCSPLAALPGNFLLPQSLRSGFWIDSRCRHLLFLRHPVCCVLTFPEAENSPPFAPAMFAQSASMKSSSLSSLYSSCRHHGYHLPPLSSSPWLPFTIIITAAMRLAPGEALCTSHVFLGRSFLSSHHFTDEGTKLRG